MRNAVKPLLALLISAFPAAGYTTQSSQPDLVLEPRNVSFCELAKDPAAYNHALIRVTAFITHGFEDFSLADPNCPALPHRFGVWIMYGGKTRSDTVYCCPGERGEQTRSESLQIEGVPIPLVDDLVFQHFKELLKQEPDTTVHVTVTGRFFLGEKQTSGGPTSWGGFGHLGCCSLLVIQKVERFEPHTRNDLDYTAEAGWYEYEGCKDAGVRDIRYVSITYGEGTAEQAITEQAMADSGERAWAFTDPQLVAIDSLKTFYKDRAPVLRIVKKTPGRRVFRWRDGKKAIIVVVIRPYWLSFYAKSSSVAWIASIIKEADCR